MVNFTSVLPSGMIVGTACGNNRHQNNQGRQAAENGVMAQQ
jgi:hypothetical protein